MRKDSERSREYDRPKSFGDRPRFGGGFNAPRKMNKAVCADCGKDCEVPFVPKADRPVYCRECYAKHRPPKRF